MVEVATLAVAAFSVILLPNGWAWVSAMTGWALNFVATFYWVKRAIRCMHWLTINLADEFESRHTARPLNRTTLDCLGNDRPRAASRSDDPARIRS